MSQPPFTILLSAYCNQGGTINTPARTNENVGSFPISFLDDYKIVATNGGMNSYATICDGKPKDKNSFFFGIWRVDTASWIIDFGFNWIAIGR